MPVTGANIVTLKTTHHTHPQNGWNKPIRANTKQSLGMAHALQECLDDNAEKLGSGLYKDLSDLSMKIAQQYEESQDDAEFVSCVRVVSAIPNAINSSAVRYHAMEDDFMEALVNYKVKELRKIQNPRMRSAMGKAWKKDMVESLLDSYSAQAFVKATDEGGQPYRKKLQDGVLKLFKMKIGMLESVTARLDDLGILASKLFPATLDSSCYLHPFTDKKELLDLCMPGAKECLALEPRFLYWLTESATGEAWPTAHSFAQKPPEMKWILNALLDIANEHGGNDPLINSPCMCMQCSQSGGFIDIVGEYQEMFEKTLFNVDVVPCICTYSYDSGAGSSNGWKVWSQDKKGMPGAKREIYDAYNRANVCRAAAKKRKFDIC